MERRQTRKMNVQYFQVFISAEQTAQANRILDGLIARQLVFGGR